MNFSKEMMEKAKKAASAEDLRKFAAEEGITLTAEKAEQYFSFLFNNCELPDDALEAVAGGKHSKAKYYNGQHVKWWFGSVSLTGTIRVCEYSKKQGAWYYITYADNGQFYQGESCDGKSWDLPLELSVYRTEVL